MGFRKGLTLLVYTTQLSGDAASAEANWLLSLLLYAMESGGYYTFPEVYAPGSGFSEILKAMRGRADFY